MRIERAFELLRKAQRPVALVGSQLRWSRRREAYPTFASTFGMPIYVSGIGMKHVGKAGTFNRLMIAQDVGSAIKGPERGDIYFGSGDAAGRLAGVTKHPGTFITLLANPAPATAQAAPQKAPAKKAQQ